MKRIGILVILIFLPMVVASAQRVTVVPKSAETRVDVLIDGRIFASYRWDEKIKRPVLFPIMSSGGKFVTRGFPVQTRDGETINHPHQVGSSLVYGDVNGIDFWNNSPFRNTDELKRMGRIDLKEVVRTKSGDRRGELVTRSDWVHPNGKVMLEETTKLTFNADGRKRWIDRETVLKAVGEDVAFGDNKEGFFAVHLNVSLQQDDQFPVKVTSEGGVIGERKTGEGLTGRYFTSNGIVGNALWGTPAKWAAVTGAIEGEKVTVAVFDHPKNPNFPSNMMVRPYGLLALNPFGQRAFVPTKAERKFTLASGKSVSFKHRLAILPNKADVSAVEAEYQTFTKAK